MPNPMSAEAIGKLRGQWARQEIVKTIINAMVEANGGVRAVPAGRAADHILSFLAHVFERADQLEAARARVVELEAENATLRQRAATSIQFAGGQSPITCGSTALQSKGPSS